MIWYIVNIAGIYSQISHAVNTVLSVYRQFLLI